MCVMIIHDNATKVLHALGGPSALVISVSSDDMMRDIMAGNGSGVFAPDAKCNNMPNAKAHDLHEFCIDLRWTTPT